MRASTQAERYRHEHAPKPVTMEGTMTLGNDRPDSARATLLAAGATERSAPRQVAREARVCVLADADGNPIGLRGR